MANTYSFTECIVTLNHPSLGTLSTNGLGMGSVTVNNEGVRASKNVASDGNVIINKIKDRSGIVTLSIQQVSDLQADLIKWFNYLEIADASEWAKIVINVNSISTKENHVCTGCAMQKIPNKEYSAEASNVSWDFICSDIQNN